MGWIAAIVVGALAGWIASLVMRTDAEQGALANIIIGIVGAVVGRYLFADVLGINGAAAAGSFSLAGVLWALVGSVILIAVLKAFRVMGS